VSEVETQEAEQEQYISPFIEDGYTADRTIPAVTGRWSAITIRFRPLSADEESLIFAKKNLAPTEPIVRFYAEAFAGDRAAGIPAKLLGWDLKDRKGNKVEITADNLRHRLPPQLFDVIKAIIDGSSVETDIKN
jgi:hypothetical protein